MSSDLLDVNVWLALEVKTHALHNVATAWFRGRGDTGCAFCRVTQMAFLRLLTNKAVMGPDAQTPAEAWWTYRQMLDSSEAVWLPEPDDLDAKWEQLGARSGVTGSWWTDAYLAAFAMNYAIRLVTFDRDLRRFEADGLNLLAL